MKNRIKEMVTEGHKALGTVYELGGNIPAQCLGISGLDFFMLDTEHGPFSTESVLASIAAAMKYSVVPLVRVKDASRSSVMKMLDIGAAGVVVPCIETVEEVKRLVQYAKFFPLGSRGYAPTSAGSFGYADYSKNMDAYFSISNQETLLLPQCETAGCLAHIEEITSMEGVDGILIGPYDLSVALGMPGHLDTQKMQRAIARILAACKASGKLSFIYTGSPETARAYFDQGFDCVLCGIDTIILIEAYRTLIKQVKA